jgi:SAM-dependent methyltransferase
MAKSDISNWFRKTGLLPFFDRLYFLLNKFWFRKKNKRFRKENPLVEMPPDYLIYESFRMDYTVYYKDGKDTAAWLMQQWSEFLPSNNLNILDWGSGPARVVRHLPYFLPESRIYAADYNEQTIQWCKQNISGIEFVKNDLEPPLSFHDHYFDVIYALSVFTHLSLQNQNKWMDEIYRLLKPGGIFLFTTQGHVFTDKLSAKEKRTFLQGLPIVRGQVKEGHRSFTVFHPKPFMQSILSDRWKVLKLIEGEMQNWGPEQDTWIVQKSK